jgi:hypothetical protein
MSVRCKMQLQQITAVHWSPTTKLVKFQAQYDTTIPEDQRFAKATPSGEITMQVDNPVALEQLKLGGYYYVDFNPAETP